MTFTGTVFNDFDMLFWWKSHGSSITRYSLFCFLPFSIDLSGIFYCSCIYKYTIGGRQLVIRELMVFFWRGLSLYQVPLNGQRDTVLKFESIFYTESLPFRLVA
jgi:hypothetical protein